MSIAEQTRPNPDVLLARVEAEEQRQSRGRLKIFFGACAGVGKTYAMLEAARAKKREGIDVVVGIVETHKRKETEALTQGFEILPARWIEYKNTKLREFDLPGAIKRRPALILIDELAHTNAPGCENTKRHNDVEALLDAGIDVYTTLNVQHMESLNDVVAQITGVAVRETVPDSVVETADDIELIDLPPDDLLLRLKDGKVYLGEQAGRAAQNFFRPGNLAALRELALRRTADRVNRQVQSYKQAQAGTGVWATTERIMVCVGPGPFSGRLVRAARRMAAGLQAQWIAVFAETPALAALAEAERERIRQHLRLAEQLGAETVTLPGRNVVESLVAFARERNITKIIIGKPARPRWREFIFGSVVEELIRQSGDIDVYVIKGEREVEPRTRQVLQLSPLASWHPYGLAALIVLLATGICWLMFPYFQLPNLIMVYLVGVIVAAIRFGRGPAILCSVFSVAAFDFCFVPPYFTFAVADSQYLITFAVMLLVAVVIGSLTARVQAQAASASLREQRTAAQYEMSRELSTARGAANVIAIGVKHLALLFESEVVGLMAGPDERLEIAAGSDVAFQFNARERAVAQWVFDLRQPAGAGTDTLAGAEALYLPLNGAQSVVGVLGLRSNKAGRVMSPEQFHLLETCATQIALAIERDQLAEKARQAQVQAETERSRNTLLSSVSHDLRTPLAAICGASSSLLSQSANLSPSAQRELIHTIDDEGNRLARLVSNLLEMTRLESGTIELKRELCPIEEIVGAALSRMEARLKDRPVKADLPEGLPPLMLDVVMMEQVFINLLDNAAKHTPEGTAIELSAEAGDKELLVRVADHGPGINEDERQRVFEKFFRGGAAPRPGGVGLGLAICRTIVEARGGRISVQNTPAGGAVFTIALPMTAQDSKGGNSNHP